MVCLFSLKPLFAQIALSDAPKPVNGQQANQGLE
jgi:hypothetical protein